MILAVLLFLAIVFFGLSLIPWLLHISSHLIGGLMAFVGIAMVTVLVVSIILWASERSIKKRGD